MFSLTSASTSSFLNFKSKKQDIISLFISFFDFPKKLVFGFPPWNLPPDGSYYIIILFSLTSASTSSFLNFKSKKQDIISLFISFFDFPKKLLFGFPPWRVFKNWLSYFLSSPSPSSWLPVSPRLALFLSFFLLSKLD